MILRLALFGATGPPPGGGQLESGAPARVPAGLPAYANVLLDVLCGGHDLSVGADEAEAPGSC
jgi:hypothetical protein